MSLFRGFYLTQLAHQRAARAATQRQIFDLAQPVAVAIYNLAVPQPLKKIRSRALVGLGLFALLLAAVYLIDCSNM